MSWPVRRLSVLTTIAVFGALGLTACGTTPSVPTTSVKLEPVSSTGADPFTPPVGQNTANVTPPSNAGGTIAGNAVGLYGGTLSQSTCDPTAMVTFLGKHQDKASAWAAVLGITPGDIPRYVRELTPAILRSDTFVVNHGFANGQATTVPSVLQAGTAVLVDSFGFPVTRCFCGNPLTKPTSFSRVIFEGPQWTSFSSTSLTVIQSTTVVVNQFILVEPTTGVFFERPRGTQGSRDTHVTKPGPSGAPPSGTTGGPPPAFVPPTSAGAPPTTAPATTTAPPTTTAAPPHTTVPHTTAPPTSVPASGSSSAAPPGLAPPPASTSASAAPSPSTSAGVSHGAPPAAPSTASPTVPPTASPTASPAAEASTASWVVGDCHVADGQLHATVLVKNDGASGTHSYQATVEWGPSGSPYATTTASVAGVQPGETGQSTVTESASGGAPSAGTVPCAISKIVDESGHPPAAGPALPPPPDTQPSVTPTTEPPTTEPRTTEPSTTEPRTTEPSTTEPETSSPTPSET